MGILIKNSNCETNSDLRNINEGQQIITIEIRALLKIKASFLVVVERLFCFLNYFSSRLFQQQNVVYSLEKHPQNVCVGMQLMTIWISNFEYHLQKYCFCWISCPECKYIQQIVIKNRKSTHQRGENEIINPHNPLSKLVASHKVVRRTLSQLFTSTETMGVYSARKGKNCDLIAALGYFTIRRLNELQMLHENTMLQVTVYNPPLRPSCCCRVAVKVAVLNEQADSPH